jgi:hypothetical protein
MLGGHDTSIIKREGGWSCVICDVKLSTVEKMEEHSKGDRHTFFLEDLKSRSVDYQEFVFWRGVEPLIPLNPCIFPRSHYSLERARRLNATMESVPEGDTSKRNPAFQLPFLVSKKSFFDSNYSRSLPPGTFFCEPCLLRFSSGLKFSEHLDSLEHRESMSCSLKLEADYFQPVRNQDEVFFIGLISRTVITDPDFFLRRQTALMLQWKVADRAPSPNSVIMETTPDEMRRCLIEKSVQYEVEV